jgi:SHS2 domain-containing protein
MDKPFEVLDISGDIGLRITGSSLEELFINGGIGLYSLITDLSAVKERESVKVRTTSESLEGLFIGWLNELIFQFDAYGFIGHEILIEDLSENSLEALIRGEEFNPDIHERGLLVKAATFHNLRLENKEGIWSVEVVFDI